MVQEGVFQSRTVFFAPIWTEDYQNFVSSLRKDGRYVPTEKKEIPQYLLPYITEIYRNDELYSEFLLKAEHLPELYMYEDRLREGSHPHLEEIRLSCFSTGCIFAELVVTYEGMDPDEIADFSFRFKRATSPTKGGTQRRMIDALEELMPRGADFALFFTSSDFKRECKMFHQIRLERALPHRELEGHLIRLRRGYHRDFPIPNGPVEHDMLFEPYDYDHWAGSPDGLINIFHPDGNPATDDYLEHYKPLQLSGNYRFMYLVLLNQRFSAIQYLEKISRCKKDSPKAIKALNRMTSQLKIVFSFSVVSDDQLYQEIYTRMYSILGIDRLLEDIRDNEAHVEMLQTHELVEGERLSGYLLTGLSILSLASVLVDAASYIDRFQTLPLISTVISAGICGGLLIWYLIWRKRFHDK